MSQKGLRAIRSQQVASAVTEKGSRFHSKSITYRAAVAYSCTVAAATRFAPVGLVVLLDSVHERLTSNSNCNAESRADLNTNCARAQMTMAKHATACDDESNRV